MLHSINEQRSIMIRKQEKPASMDEQQKSLKKLKANKT